MQDSERFDIVVVGVQGDGAHEATLAADLSALVGIPPGEVALALNQGELYVHRAFVEEDACRAADSLRRLGAEVEVRPCEASVEMPVIEADPERPPPGIRDVDGGGGLAPAPIAPPPEFGEAAISGRSIAIGSAGPPRPTDPDLLDPSRPQGRPQALSSERPFLPVAERTTTGRRRAVPRQLPGRGEDSHDAAAPVAPGQAAAIDSPPPGGWRATPRSAAEPEPAPELAEPSPPASASANRRPLGAATRGKSGFIDPAESLAEKLEAAAESAQDIEVVTLDGQTSDSVQVRLEPTPPSTDPAVLSPEGIDVKPSAPAVAKDEPLSLDLETGPSEPREAIVAAEVDPRKRPSGEYSHRRPTSSSSFRPAAAASPAAAAPSPSVAPAAAVVEAPRAARRLFSRDMLTNYLFGVAAGLLVGIVIAFQAARTWDRDDIMALEEELAKSYVRPLDVDNGDLRPPDEVRRDLDAMYSDTRIFFILTMIFTGVPAGLGIGRIRFD